MRLKIIAPAGAALFLACTPSPVELVQSPTAKVIKSTRPAKDIIQDIASTWSSHAAGVTVTPVRAGTLISLPAADAAVLVSADGTGSLIRYGIRPLLFTPAWIEEGITSAK